MSGADLSRLSSRDFYNDLAASSTDANKAPTTLNSLFKAVENACNESNIFNAQIALGPLKQALFELGVEEADSVPVGKSLEDALDAYNQLVALNEKRPKDTGISPADDAEPSEATPTPASAASSPASGSVASKPAVPPKNITDLTALEDLQLSQIFELATRQGDLGPNELRALPPDVQKAINKFRGSGTIPSAQDLQIKVDDQMETFKGKNGGDFYKAKVTWTLGNHAITTTIYTNIPAGVTDYERNRMATLNKDQGIYNRAWIKDGRIPGFTTPLTNPSKELAQLQQDIHSRQQIAKMAICAAAGAVKQSVTKALPNDAGATVLAARQKELTATTWTMQSPRTLTSGNVNAVKVSSGDENYSIDMRTEDVFTKAMRAMKETRPLLPPESPLLTEKNFRLEDFATSKKKTEDDLNTLLKYKPQEWTQISKELSFQMTAKCAYLESVMSELATNKKDVDELLAKAEKKRNEIADLNLQAKELKKGGQDTAGTIAKRDKAIIDLNTLLHDQDQMVKKAESRTVFETQLKELKAGIAVFDAISKERRTLGGRETDKEVSEAVSDVAMRLSFFNSNSFQSALTTSDGRDLTDRLRGKTTLTEKLTQLGSLATLASSAVEDDNTVNPNSELARLTPEAVLLNEISIVAKKITTLKTDVKKCKIGPGIKHLENQFNTLSIELDKIDVGTRGGKASKAFENAQKQRAECNTAIEKKKNELGVQDDDFEPSPATGRVSVSIQRDDIQAAGPRRGSLSPEVEEGVELSRSQSVRSPANEAKMRSEISNLSWVDHSSAREALVAMDPINDTNLPTLGFIVKVNPAIMNYQRNVNAAIDAYFKQLEQTGRWDVIEELTKINDSKFHHRLSHCAQAVQADLQKEYKKSYNHSLGDILIKQLPKHIKERAEISLRFRPR